MAIPTTKQIVDLCIAKFETALGQTVPNNDKAFFRVLSAILGILFTALYKFGNDSTKQCLATTAGIAGLTILGDEYDVPRKQAVATVLTVTLPGTNGTIIPATNDFVSDSTGLRYSIDASATVTGGFATLSITATQAGTIGNLSNGETLSIGSPVAGAESTATVTATTTTGANTESIENWRLRILDKIRAPGGGGNAADYRNWSQEVAGVARAYPYAGGPDTLITLPPPNRTVYIESTTAIDADGIPPASLIDDVRDNITTDPITGLARQPLGLTDDTLYVEPITRTSFYVKITGLNVDSSIEAAVKSEIESQLSAFFRAARPFVDGVDAAIDRSDVITDISVSTVVQSVMTANGGYAQGVAFDTTLGGSISEYTLGQGETAKLSAVSGVTYA